MISLNMAVVNYRGTSGVVLTMLVSMMCHSAFAETAVLPIDDRCEVLKAFDSFEKRVFQTCDIEVNTCIEERMSQIVESREQAEKNC